MSQTSKTRRLRYREHKENALRRSIPFGLTYEQWCKIWDDSGHWAERGRRVGQFVMARKGDVGAYEIGNVEIVTVYENGSAPSKCAAVSAAYVAHAHHQGPSGEKSHTAKLTEAKVRLIRRSERPSSFFAARYGTTLRAIEMVRSRATWRHI